MRKLVYTNGIGQSIEIGTDPYLIESLEGLDLPSPDIQSTRAPVQDGSTYIDTLLGNREIVVRGSINAAQDLQSIYVKRRQLSSVLNPKLGKGTLSLTIGGEPLLYPSASLYPSATLYPYGYTTRTCKNVLVSALQFENKFFQNPFQGFQAQFDCLDPYFYDTLSTTLALSSGVALVVNNYSDFDTPVTLNLIGGTNPAITNQTKGDTIAFTYSGGGTIVVTTEFGNKTAKIGGSSVIGNLDIGSVFWNLAPGSNTILLTGGGSGTISWTQRYIGV